MIKITFLIDKNNNWIHKFLKINNFGKKYNINFNYNPKKIKNNDIVFILSYTKILNEKFLSANRLNLVIHSSDLPKNRGFAPLTYQILKGQKKIVNTIFKPSSKADRGDFYYKNYFINDGTELYEELRKKQALSIIKLIKKFLSKYPKVKPIKQKGKGTFNKRRTPKDSELNIKKSLKSQFNLLRTCDNEKFPAFFVYKKKKYFLKIFK